MACNLKKIRPKIRYENCSGGNSSSGAWLYVYKIIVARGVLDRMRWPFLSDTQGTDILLLKGRKFRSREPSMKCKGPCGGEKGPGKGTDDTRTLVIEREKTAGQRWRVLH